ncbi:MAG: hypothetical protein SOR89_04415 [Ndongobacter sp.]|nr:hypothetical protein [Ndongobacter sp.]
MKNKELDEYRKLPYFQKLRKPIGFQFRMLSADIRARKEERRERERIKREIEAKVLREFAEEHKDDPNRWHGWHYGAL